MLTCLLTISIDYFRVENEGDVTAAHPLDPPLRCVGLSATQKANIQRRLIAQQPTRHQLIKQASNVWAASASHLHSDLLHCN